jgi:hypothetical protein
MADFEYEAADESDVIEYWQYILGKPIAKNPTTDPDGSKHDVTTNPVFLASNATRGPANRTLRDISADKSMVAAVNPCVVAQPHVPSGSLNDCKKFAEEDEDSAKTATLTIDGTTIDLKELGYRVKTRPFDVDVPENAIHNTPPGRWKAVADGYYIKLKQLTPGRHRINFKGEVDTPYNEKPPWDQDITYQFTVN